MSTAESDDQIVGAAVFDAAGEPMGQVASLYQDSGSGEVSFAGVSMVRRGRRRLVFVPITNATITPAKITVQCSKDLARRAPSVRPGEVLPVAEEAELFTHYDMPYAALGAGERRLNRYEQLA